MKIPNAESLILFAFLGCIALWAVSKCTARRSDFVRQELMADDESEEPPVRKDTVVAVAPQKPLPTPAAPVTIPAPPQYSSTLRQPNPVPDRPAETAPPKPGSTSKPGTTLYVTIDGLKVRKEPGLKGQMLEQLALYTPVTFLNQKTEWTQEISLGYEKVTDHWIKIKTAKGNVGWVFGAGLHYYKMKRSGVTPNKPAETKKKNTNN